MTEATVDDKEFVGAHHAYSLETNITNADLIASLNSLEAIIDDAKKNKQVEESVYKRLKAQLQEKRAKLQDLTFQSLSKSIASKKVITEVQEIKEQLSSFYLKQGIITADQLLTLIHRCDKRIGVLSGRP